MNRVRLFWENRIVSRNELEPEQSAVVDVCAFAHQEPLNLKTKRSFVLKLAFLSLMALVISLLGASNASALNRFSVATGNWNSTATWSASSGGASGASVPIAGDVVTIEGGFTVTVTAAAACTTLTINNTGTLSLTSGTNNLTISNGGSVTVNSGGSGVFNATSVVNGGANGGGNGVALTINSGASLTTANTGGFATTASNTVATGSFAVNRGNVATQSYSTGANYTYNGSAAQITGTALTGANNLTINNSAGVTLTSGTTVTGTLTLTNGTFTNAGNLTLGNGATISRDTGSLSAAPTFTTSVNVTYTGTTAVTSGNELPSSTTVLNNLTINKSGGVTLGASRTVNGVLALNSGDITTGANVLTQSGTSTGAGDVIGDVRRTDLAAGVTKSFGNIDVQVTIGATGTINTMTVNLVKQAPPSFASAVTRTYTLTPGAGTIGTSPTLRLRYRETPIDERNGNNEATLQLWRLDGSTWQPQGGTPDTANNYVTLTPVTGFSSWVIAGPNAPTDVAMVSLKATRYDDRVLVEWQTGFEVGNVGFNIYREQNGKLTKVTPDPVAGSALIAGPKVLLRAGFAYSWWDNEAKFDDSFVQYWLEDIDVSGRTFMRGPYGIEQPRAGDKAPPSGKKSSSLSALGPEASKRGSTVRVEPMAGVVKLTPELLETQATVASSPAIKLSVQHEGWYRVEQIDLVAAGFSANVDPRKLQLFVDGQQVPIIVTGEKDGKFDRSDGVEFYGIGINSASTLNHIYWLIAGSQKGQRINTVGGKGTSQAPPTFSYTVERRDKVIYFSAIKNGGGEKFFGPLIYNAQPVDQSLVLQNIAASGNASLEVSLQGFTLAPHSVKVLLNGAELTTIQFDGQAKGTATLSIPQSSLIEGSNQVQLIGPAGFSDMSLVEYVRLTYQHTNNADGDELRFTATGKQLASIGSFTNSSVRVVDVTNPNSVQELVGTVKQTGSTFTISAVVPGTGVKTLLAFAAGQQTTPAAMVLDEPSSWRTHGQAADYVAITRKDLLNSIQPLKTQRQSQGLLVAVVDVEDVYDEFSFGNKSPQALKDFLSYAKTSWTKAPRFVLFAGDATYDPKNYTGVGDFDLVPTKLIETAFGETATDDWFVDFNGDGVPDMAIGRLPVRTDQEAASMVSKIVGYDSSAAIPRVLLVVDHNDGYDFEAADTQLQSLIPGNLTVTDIRRGQVGDADARSQLIDAINQGTKLVNFYGHGSVRVWTDAPILTATDAPNFVNTNGLALFNAMTCLNGFFHDVSVDSLGEALLKAPGGAIAVWASSGLTEPSSQVPMSEEAVRLLFNGAGLTIGEVTTRAKAAGGDLDVRRTWILLGDPATKLK